MQNKSWFLIEYAIGHMPKGINKNLFSKPATNILKLIETDYSAHLILIT